MDSKYVGKVLKATSQQMTSYLSTRVSYILVQPMSNHIVRYTITKSRISANDSLSLTLQALTESDDHLVQMASECFCTDDLQFGQSIEFTSPPIGVSIPAVVIAVP